MNAVRSALLVIWVFLIAGCASPVGEPQAELPLPRETAVALLAELHLAEAVLKTQEQYKRADFDLTIEAAYDLVYRKFEVDSVQVAQLNAFLLEQPLQAKQLYDEVAVKLTERQAEAKAGAKDRPEPERPVTRLPNM